jgi:acyl carrier protein
MQDRDAIRKKLIEIMEADTGETYGDIEESKDLRAELGLDSVDVVSIVSNVERHYRIRLNQQELEKLVKFGDVLDLLQSKLIEAEQEKKAA